MRGASRVHGLGQIVLEPGQASLLWVGLELSFLAHGIGLGLKLRPV